MQEGALFAQIVVEFHEHGKRAVRKAACSEFAQLDVLEFREHPAEAFDDFVFEGGEQAFFVAEVVVERAAVQAGARAQVAHREAVDATFFDERDEGFAQRGARAGDAWSRSAAAVVVGVAAGATTAEAADVGAAAAEAAGIAAGAGAATAAPVAESETGIGAAASNAACASCALVAVFDAVKCPPWVQSSGLLNRLIIIQHIVQ